MPGSGFDYLIIEGVQARDIIHVAVMMINNLPQIISTDTHFDKIQGVRRYDPKVVAAKTKQK